ncbi:MAG: hypothetical protein L6406_01880, partial [Desulfobacterales bacterium]|nr:hypothetical protein [Desulfobacterales bacterium]
MLKYVYLTSSGYSGSTLLAFMMGAHPKIATVGELGAAPEVGSPDNYRCSCGNLLKNCAFWSQVSIRLQTLHKDFSYRNFGTALAPRGNTFLHRLQFGNLRSNRISDIRDYIFNRIPKCYNHANWIVKRNIDLASSILEVTNKDIFFDTSKNPAKINLLKENLECDLKVIHLIKDGRGVFDSIKKYYPERPDYKA